MESEGFSSALGLALKLLAKRQTYVSQLRKKLLQAGVAETVAEQVIVHLQAKGILNDQRVAEEQLRLYTGKKAFSPERLRAELKKAGAPAELIEEFVPELPLEEEKERMLTAVSLRYPKGATAPKAARCLASLGYEEERIIEFIEREFPKSLVE